MNIQCPDWIHQLVSFKLENGGEFSETDLCKSKTFRKRAPCSTPKPTLLPTVIPSKPTESETLSGSFRQRGSVSGVGRQRSIRAGRDFCFVTQLLLTSISITQVWNPGIFKNFPMKNGELLSLALDSPSFFRDAQGPECLVAFGGSYAWNLGEVNFILRNSTNVT